MQYPGRARRPGLQNLHEAELRSVTADIDGADAVAEPRQPGTGPEASVGVATTADVADAVMVAEMVEVVEVVEVVEMVAMEISTTTTAEMPCGGSGRRQRDRAERNGGKDGQCQFAVHARSPRNKAPWCLPRRGLIGAVSPIANQSRSVERGFEEMF